LRCARLAIHSVRVAVSPVFEELLAEGASVPVAGWDFSCCCVACPRTLTC
jgi:hypothetical protein